MFFSPVVAQSVTIGKIGYKFTIFFLERNFLPSISYFCRTISSGKRMNRNTLASIALTFTIFCGTCLSTGAQDIRPDSLSVPVSTQHDTLSTEASVQQDTIIAAPGISAEERLKAKVDSLRNALSETTPPRRRLSVQRQLANADSLRLRYDFPAAEEILRRAAQDADSTQVGLVEDALAMTRNGLNMMGYCSAPVVVAKQKFALEDFFLMYPMEEGAWRMTPNPLDSQGDAFNQATYIPEDARIIYFSAQDSEGIRNIYMTHSSEGKWSVPSLLNENLTSASDEIFPVLSQDERTLYFASRGLYGMGGYDLYSSRWNRETNDWEQPVNMGFPYSSPYDDFLFMNTADGRYSIFASNRECSADSVYIYVLEYDALPVRHAVEEVRELRRLASLSPARGRGLRDAREATEERAGGADVNAYLEKMSDVRTLRDSIYMYNKEMDAMRARLAEIPVEEQSGHIEAILEKEKWLPEIQARLDQAEKDLQDIELEFLASGVLPSTARPAEEPEEGLRHEPSFEFIRHNYGGNVYMDVMKPESDSGFSFEILPESQFADDDELPDGLVYQIQIASGSNKLRVSDLHGISPVFEKMSTALRYTYSVGIFLTYGDALSHLNCVRTAGFKDAFITAFFDGKQIPVSEARSMDVRSMNAARPDPPSPSFVQPVVSSSSIDEL